MLSGVGLYTLFFGLTRIPPNLGYNCFMGETIYVSVCCLGMDTELETTIDSCFESAHKPEYIHMGIAIIGNKNFYEKINKKYGDNKNLTIKFFELNENTIGVGNGRHLAKSLYNNEDYFFQIDSHTCFDTFWDKDLIYNFKKSQELVNNKKVILSGYLPNYTKENKNGKVEISYATELWYTKWIPNKFRILNKTIPSWESVIPKKVSKKLYKKIKKTGFAPASKITAMFIFGDKQFANNLCLDKSLLFWEEEIIQSIEFIANGFTLVFPGTICPGNHFYFEQKTEDFGHRETIASLFNGEELDKFFLKMEENFLNYLKDENNKEKIKVYEKYAGINLLTGAKNDRVYSKKYANIGYDPVII
jgi:hypothetical protein